MNGVVVVQQQLQMVEGRGNQLLFPNLAAALLILSHSVQAARGLGIVEVDPNTKHKGQTVFVT